MFTPKQHKNVNILCQTKITAICLKNFIFGSIIQEEITECYFTRE